jgi:hypothetical protein
MNAEPNPHPSTDSALECFDKPDTEPRLTLVEPEVMPRRPVSERRLAANRANALKSTGPRTKAGKEVVRTNAITHGLYATVWPKGEVPGLTDPRMLEQLVSQYQEDFKPKTQLEMTLIELLAVDLVRLRQIHAMEARFYEDVFHNTHPPRAPTLSSYSLFPDGETEEQVRHELAVAENMLEALRQNRAFPLPAEDAELIAKRISHHASQAEESLKSLLKEREQSSGPTPPKPIPQNDGGPPSGTPALPKPGNQARQCIDVTDPRSVREWRITNMERQTLKGLGVQSGESLVDVLLAGRTPPEDSLAGWQAVVSQIQSRACNILKGVAQARKQEENKRAQAHRDALDMSPKLDQLNRQEAMIRRNIERTLKQLRGVRHELFA